MLDWIEKQTEPMNNIYERCNDKPVLEAFTVYLFRILNGLSQMAVSQFYDYEVQILGEAMRLFFTYYIEQVNKILSSESNAGSDSVPDFEKKKSILEDIEYAISKISNVYKNVIDGTANSDRQMLTSQAVETNIYDLSPKLFITYSTILSTLVGLFDKQEKYAFLLHPSLKSNIETESLFNTREEEGKVVLIYIPENEIEKIRLTPVYLLHEVYHVLTREERCRLDRARRMETHVLNAIYQRIFKNVDFDLIISETGLKNDKSDKEAIKQKLLGKWFPIKKWMEGFESITNERYFYSKNISSDICKRWLEALSKIFATLGEDVREVLISMGKYKAGEELFSCVTKSEWAIHNNLVEIISGNLVTEYVWLYMSIYREAYADVACILTTGISPEIYKEVFKNSEIAIPEEISDQETVRALRVHVVAYAISTCEGVSYHEEWKDYSKKNDFRKKTPEPEKGKEDKKSIRKQKDRISILEEDLKSLEEIMEQCCHKLLESMGKKESRFKNFRNILEKLDMIEILNGKTINDLHNL